jgi:hypothetical protein
VIVAMLGSGVSTLACGQQQPEIPKYVIDPQTTIDDPCGAPPLVFKFPPAFSRTLTFYKMVQPFLVVTQTGKCLNGAQFNVKCNAITYIDIDLYDFTRPELDLDGNPTGKIDRFRGKIKCFKIANWDGTKPETRAVDPSGYENDEYIVNSHKCVFDFCFAVCNDDDVLPFCLDAGVYKARCVVNVMVCPFFGYYGDFSPPANDPCFGDPCKLPFVLFP